MILRVLLIIIVSILVIAGVLLFLFPYIEVCGESMYPTYKDGEIIRGYRIHKKLQVGDVVVYRCPTDNKKVIKRVCGVDGSNSLYFFLGDNREYSYDSRHYGCVSKSSIVCKVKSRPYVIDKEWIRCVNINL